MKVRFAISTIMMCPAQYTHSNTQLLVKTNKYKINNYEDVVKLLAVQKKKVTVLFMGKILSYERFTI